MSQVHVKASRVKESAFSVECELYQATDIDHPVTGENTCTLILGHIEYIHVHNDMLTKRGTIDITMYKPVARLGDISYARVGDAFRIPCPVWTAWAKEESKVEEALRRF